MSTLALAELPAMQAAFVAGVISGLRPALAAEQAGYSDPKSSTYQLLNSPAVLAAIHAGVQRELQRDAGVNLGVLRRLRDAESTPARVRADIGLKLLSLAGHVQPTAKDQREHKPLAQMTREEMVRFIEENQASVEAAERELMARATDITPAPIVPTSVPSNKAKASKPLSFLD